MKVEEKTITIKTVRFSDQDIRNALIEWAYRCKPGIEGIPEVEISPDTSWEAEGENMFTASITFTVEK